MDTHAGVTHELRLPPLTTSAPWARQVIRRVLVDVDRADLLDDAQLLTSELVTNALVHAGSDMLLRVTATSDGIRVEVTDSSGHLPSERHYGRAATIGRGLLLVQDTATQWGVTPDVAGKTVWFELGTLPVASPSPPSPRPAEPDDALSATPADADTVEVQLRNVPLLLHAAWQQHAEALLREYLLASLERPAHGVDPVSVHAAAMDAAMILQKHIPPPDDLGAALSAPAERAPHHVTLHIPRSSIDHFTTLDVTLDAAAHLADQQQLLLVPTQPEVRELRRWLCREVERQVQGAAPQPWRHPDSELAAPSHPVSWDTSGVTSATEAVVAADDTNRILAVSASAVRLLGYDDAAGLVGRRIVAMVPGRFRQQHIAGFTLHLLTGRSRLIGKPVVVPALRRDGTEVPVELTLRAQPAGQGRTVFLATMRAQ